MSRFSQASVMTDSGGGSTNGVKVDTEELLTLGTYLSGAKESVELLMDALDTAMGGIKSSWGDTDGETFVTSFSTFITEAKKIGDEINSLGTFASGEAGKYDTILQEALRLMGGGE